MEYTEAQIRQAVKDFGRSRETGRVDIWLAHYETMATEATRYVGERPFVNAEIVEGARLALSKFRDTRHVDPTEADKYIMSVLNAFADLRTGA